MTLNWILMFCYVILDVNYHLIAIHIFYLIMPTFYRYCLVFIAFHSFVHIPNQYLWFSLCLHLFIMFYILSLSFDCFPTVSLFSQFFVVFELTILAILIFMPSNAKTQMNQDQPLGHGHRMPAVYSIMDSVAWLCQRLVHNVREMGSICWHTWGIATSPDVPAAVCIFVHVNHMGFQKRSCNGWLGCVNNQHSMPTLCVTAVSICCVSPPLDWMTCNSNFEYMWMPSPQQLQPPVTVL
jgi:hypothetical protein